MTALGAPRPTPEADEPAIVARNGALGPSRRGDPATSRSGFPDLDANAGAISASSGGGPEFLDLLSRAVPPADPSARARVGRFEVIAPLGRGTFGTVLLARDPELRRDCALKLPSPRTLSSPDALARFLQEGRKAALVDHPNVVRVLEAGTAEGTAYLALEFCPGGSLAAWLAARPLGLPVPPPWAADLVARVADGVHHAHEAGLLHRDLKPGNVLLACVLDPADPDPPPADPKVGDFGLAKLRGPDAGDSAEATAPGTPVGTLPYMSPEAARGGADVAEAVDVYGLGVLLFHLLTRRRPFDGDGGDAGVLARLLAPEPAPSARSLCPGVPPRPGLRVRLGPGQAPRRPLRPRPRRWPRTSAAISGANPRGGRRGGDGRGPVCVVAEGGWWPPPGCWRSPRRRPRRWRSAARGPPRSG